MSRLTCFLLAFSMLGVIIRTDPLHYGTKLREAIKDDKTYELDRPSDTRSNLYVKAKTDSTDVLRTPLLSLANGNVYECSMGPPVSLCVLPASKINLDQSFQLQSYCITECNYDLEAYTA